MQANPKATVVSQEKEQPSGLDVAETNITAHQEMSKDDLEFVGELGWLSAAAVLVAGVAASI
jgi:hypothetical protein